MKRSYPEHEAASDEEDLLVRDRGEQNYATFVDVEQTATVVGDTPMSHGLTTPETHSMARPPSHPRNRNDSAHPAQQAQGDHDLPRRGSSLLLISRGSSFISPALMRIPACWEVSGPGMVVMLADSDAGSLIVSAQSGKVWGYSLVSLQLLLCLPLYMAQELTVRLGATTGQGYAELVASHFGRRWGILTTCTLVVVCAGALVSELTAIAGVGVVLGIPASVACGLLVAFLFIVVATGSYRQVETIALAIGCFEFAFLITMVLARPSLDDLARGLVEAPFGDQSFRTLIAANIGAVMQPWMVFYQQSAVVDKGLKVLDLPAARKDTVMGAFVTQVVATAVMLTAAGTVWDGSYDGSSAGFDSVSAISDTLTPHLGKIGGRLLFCLGFLGSATIGAIVVTLTAAWGIGEAVGFKRSLEHSLKDAPWFYGCFVVVMLVSYAIALAPLDLVTLNIAIQVLNALLLPVVLLFLFILASSDVLPAKYQLTPKERITYGITFAICSGLGLVCSLTPAF